MENNIQTLGAFEMSLNLIITVASESDTPEVSVELPRCSLTFFFNSHRELESHTYVISSMTKHSPLELWLALLIGLCYD